jgi:hypothetical protein
MFDRAVMDSGPLFTVLTLNFVRRFSAAKKKEALMRRIDVDIRNSPRLQEAYLSLFESIRSVLTTSHVIGEIQGLQNLTGEDLKSFWLLSMELLASKGLDENLLRLIEDMFAWEGVRHNVAEVGPTDAGLIELARREGCVLLTDDQRTLGVLAFRLGVDCKIFRTLLY